MRASAFEFRFRVFIIAAILVLGFWSPGMRGHTAWSALSLLLLRHSAAGFEAASLGVGYAAALLATLGALLRTWATAYLGADIVHDHAMHSGHVVADGPYRHLRNPLYVGSALGFAAVAVLMPLPGAILSVVLTGVLFWRLILREEHRLAETPGYAAYRARVPRLLPSLLPRTAPGGARPHWGQALLGEIYPWGVAVSFALFVARFNAVPIIQGIAVSFGLSLIARGLGVKTLG